MPDASPTKWHLAHVTWFFETFLLERFEPDFRPFDPAFRVLFNSYYKGVGEQYPRPHRGLVTRPALVEVKRFRADVDERMLALIAARPGDAEIESLVMLGLQHEQQHQELLLTDIKHALSFNPVAPGYARRWPISQVRPGRCAGSATRADWSRSATTRPGTAPSASTTNAASIVPMSSRSRSHRGPRPTANTSPSSTMAATCGPSSGCRWAGTGSSPAGGRRPLYWMRDGDRWLNHTLQGKVEIDPHTPVCHLSYFEADAFARWSGARLPSELEWEHAARALRAPTGGNFADRGVFHPMPQIAPIDDEPAQMFGDVWEWTSSAYLPYPRFRPLEGLVGEYNGKFMCNQFVLRGGSCATPPGTCARATATSSRPTRSGSSAACGSRATSEHLYGAVSTPSTSEPNSRW
jgi:hypothetical protein